MSFIINAMKNNDACILETSMRNPLMFDFGWKDVKGATFLHYAAMYSLEMTKFLLSYIPYDCRDNEGMTPLFYAVNGKNTDVVYYLVSIMCVESLNMKNTYNFNVYAHSIVMYPEISLYLEDAGCSPYIQSSKRLSIEEYVTKYS